jgi:microcystin-dependent protein
MARRITGGLVGSSTLLGTIQISPEAAMSTAADQDITFSPGVGGQVVSTANFQLNAQTDLRFGDADSSNWVAFQAPSTISSNVTWTLPNADGTTSQVLSTNGSGTLSWRSSSVDLVNNNTDSATHFVTFTATSTDSPISELRRSSTGMTFQPSTGILTVSRVDAGNYVGQVVWMATPSAPAGFLVANGSAVSRTTYAALFAAIGTTWGVGDGSTTFNLPNLVNRMPIGSGGLYALAATGGSKDAIVVSHTHTITDPGHRHQLRGASDTGPDGGVTPATDDTTDVALAAASMDTATTGISINNTGSSGTDANLPPYAGLLACIKF